MACYEDQDDRRESGIRGVGGLHFDEQVVSQAESSRTGVVVCNYAPTRQDRSAHSVANPANLKDLFWWLARHSSLATCHCS
jgi:hypothetical protein